METDAVTKCEKTNNTIGYSLIAAVVILLGYIIYIYMSHDMVKKGDLKKEYIKKDNISFNMLSSHEKGRYVGFYEHDSKISQLNQQISQLKKELQDAKENVQEPKIVEKIVEVEKIVKVEVPVPVEVEKSTKVVDSQDIKEESAIKVIDETLSKFNTYTCKSLEEGSVKITSVCKKQLYSFLDKNKDAKKYEVIGMVDDKDFKFINKLKDVYGAKKVKELSKYSQIGLSRQRVIEASWLIKEHIGNYSDIKTVNYTIHSQNKKGFVVRAYY